MKNNLVPFVISDDKKIEYYHTLNAAQSNGDYARLAEFFTKEQESYYQQVEGFVLPVDLIQSAPQAPKKKKQQFER